jgi:hypothetical protein
MSSRWLVSNGQYRCCEGDLFVTDYNNSMFSVHMLCVCCAWQEAAICVIHLSETCFDGVLVQSVPFAIGSLSHSINVLCAMDSESNKECGWAMNRAVEVWLLTAGTWIQLQDSLCGYWYCSSCVFLPCESSFRLCCALLPFRGWTRDKWRGKASKWYTVNRVP